MIIQIEIIFFWKEVGKNRNPPKNNTCHNIKDSTQWVLQNNDDRTQISYRWRKYFDEYYNVDRQDESNVLEEQ